MPSFSNSLEDAIHESIAIANAFQHELATLEHLLFALTSEKDAARVMIACGVDLSQLRQTLNDFIDEDLAPLTVEPGFEALPTAAFQRVIQRAAIHIQASGREIVNGDNVLVAIFAERESNAAYFLQEQNIFRYDAVNFITHGIAKNSVADDITDIISSLPPIEYPSRETLAERELQFAEENRRRREEVEARNEEAKHELEDSITAGAIRKNGGALAIQARSIELQIRNEIENSNARTPNFMSDAQKEAYLRQVDFLEELAKALGELAEEIAKSASDDSTSPERLADRLRSLQQKIHDFSSENPKTVFWLGQMPAMLGFVALFSLAGANMATATPLIMGLCGGDRIVKLVKEGFGKTK